MTDLTVNIDIEDPRWQDAIENIASAILRVKDEVCKRIGNEVDFLDDYHEFSVNLCLSNDAAVQQLNWEFRGKDKPTNVLSFAAIDDEEFDYILQTEKNVGLGDIIIAYETMQKEAPEQGVSLRDHFCHLWAHGLLHILGYDHITEEEALEMEQRETDVLHEMGIANPYQE